MKQACHDIIIAGLGLSGFAVAEFLLAKQIPFTVIDNRECPPKLEALKKLCPNLPLYTGGFPKEVLSQAKILILSPGLSKEDPLIKPYLSRDAIVMGDIELFAQNVAAKVIGITGSNGKSTVTTLVGEMAKLAGLRVGVGGNLGTPALALLQQNCELYVLELSSFQLETTHSLKLASGTILNICLDHMDRYQSLETYYQAKARIFNQCETVVVNRDDLYVLARIPPRLPAISFGMNLPPKDHFGVSLSAGLLLQGDKPLMAVSELKLSGQHNIANALAALSLGTSVGLPIEAMLSALRSFQGLSHRGEWVRTLKEVTWINDSKGTNVSATLATLQGFKNTISGKWILIAGGVSKNADFSPLKPLIQSCCRAVILIGEASETFKQLLSDVVPCILVNSMMDAVVQANKAARPGDGVLLSPACASFDMFQNFEHRGEVFKECVRSV